MATKRKVKEAFSRYDTADFLSSLYGVLHEAGHGLYNQGLSKAEWGFPAGDACSLGIHESQSRLWENHIGGSEVFWNHWLPRACHHSSPPEGWVDISN